MTQRGKAGAPGRAPAVVREEVVAEYRRRLTDRGSSIMADPQEWARARRQARELFDSVTAPGRDRPPRTVADVHPATSIQAAGDLYEVMLPAVLEVSRDSRGEGNPRGQDDDIALACRLHHELTARLSVSAGGYVDFLLLRVQRAQLEERRRVSRELHDRAAHALGVALQNLELHEVYAADDPDRSRLKLAAARDALHCAYDVVRDLATDLRAAVGPDGLEPALASCLKTLVPCEVDATLSVTGAVDALPEATAEQVFLVLREGVRNALEHSGATRLTVSVNVSGSTLRAEVTDDGTGFDAADVSAHAGVGLRSMQERIELLGGSLLLAGAPGGGTKMNILVPLPPGHTR